MHAPTGFIIALIFVCRRDFSPPALPNVMSPKAFPSGEGGRHGAKRSWLTDEENIDIKLTFSPHPPQAVGKLSSQVQHFLEMKSIGER